MTGIVDLSALAPKQCLVVGPDKKQYFLVSASVDATIKFRNASLKAGKWETTEDENGKEKFKVVGFDEVATQELVLVAATLAQSVGDAGQEVLLDRNGNPVLVPENRIKNWPGQAISILYEKALELSPWLKQGEDEVEREGKGSSANGAESSK